MVGMFDNKKTNPEIIRNLKTVFTKKFSVSKDSTISVAELRCHEPNCPPVETVFTVRTPVFEIVASPERVAAVGLFPELPIRILPL